MGSFRCPRTVSRLALGRIDEMNGVCFVVLDKNGQQLGYFYYEVEPGRRTAASLLTKDEARRLAVNFAKLLDLLISKPGVLEHDAADD